MKFKPNWAFWLLVVLAYSGNGLKGVLGLFVILAGLVLLNVILWSFTSDFRNYLIKEKGFTADGKFIQLCCKRGLHTWGEVVEDKPETEIGATFQKIYRLKYGQRKSLCCNQNQIVSTVIDGRHWSKLGEKYYCLREDCLL